MGYCDQIHYRTELHKCRSCDTKWDIASPVKPGQELPSDFASDPLYRHVEFSVSDAVEVCDDCYLATLMPPIAAPVVLSERFYRYVTRRLEGLMGRKPKKPVFEEEYVVKLNYQMPDGYWKVGHFETVLVPVTDDMVEKDNHELAEEIAKQRFPGCQIVNVTYC